MNGDEYSSGFRRGCEEEARIRDEGLSPAAREIRDVLEGFARLHGYTSKTAIVATLARIYIPARLKRRWRR